MCGNLGLLPDRTYFVYIKFSNFGTSGCIARHGKGTVGCIREDRNRHIHTTVIAEYLDEISEDRLLPADPIARARERAWVEFASATLGDIYQLYVAQDRAQFEKALASIDSKLAQVEPELAGTYFAGGHFGLVDAAFAPVFRYFDVFERRAELNVLERRPKVRAWANILLKRPSVIEAVPGNYSDLLVDFIKAKRSHLAGLIDSDLLVAA
jgi:glutathione S-transferase